MEELVYYVNLEDDSTGAGLVKVLATSEPEAMRIAERDYAPCVAISASLTYKTPAQRQS